MMHLSGADSSKGSPGVDLDGPLRLRSLDLEELRILYFDLHVRYDKRNSAWNGRAGLVPSA